jgi:hypothetical protein
VSMVEHARRELERLGEDPGLSQNLIACIAVFAAFGHSGGSALVAIDHLTRLLRQQALTPLTADPAEWADRSAESGTVLWQNLRDGRAFSDDAGATHWLLGTGGTRVPSAPAP